MSHGRLFHHPVPFRPSVPRTADRCLMRPSPSPHPVSDLKRACMLKSLSDLLLLELYQPEKGHGITLTLRSISVPFCSISGNYFVSGSASRSGFPRKLMNSYTCH